LAGTSVYSASKAALKSLTDAVREEYRKECYIGLVCPGFTKTNIFCNQGVTNTSKAQKAMDFISTDCERMCNLILKGMKNKRAEASKHGIVSDLLAYMTVPLLICLFFEYFIF
jgi:short-subunit dehydrogenase